MAQPSTGEAFWGVLLNNNGGSFTQLAQENLELELLRDVAVPTKSLDTKQAAGSSAIYFKFVTNLKGLINEKACKGHGYFLSVTNLKSIGKEGPSVNVILRYGPVKYTLMSPRRVPTYRHVSRKKPFFSYDQQPKIGNGVVVQFLVIAVRWIREAKGEI
ncbi:hypothetical protein CICLE_v10006941mg [Citrus x clementina]|uniref:Uncharacterized protein n=1 Tax=Citrus clementina TaxID=85681 RepID=V4RHB4_CITCL|nr:hypothetical protein CICLE_v10006941mg [Citrus x clementina]